MAEVRASGAREALIVLIEDYCLSLLGGLFLNACRVVEKFFCCADKNPTVVPPVLIG